MPASLIVPYLVTAFELGAVGTAVATLAIRVVTTMAISSLIAKDMMNSPPEQGNQGGRVQLPPATNNKLPVPYGESWVSPIITDVKISTDQQTMWYVLSFGETTTTGNISFGNVYWDDKRLLFDPANPSEIWGWFIEGESDTPADNTIITGVAGKISMWFYRNGSDITGTIHNCNATTEPYFGSAGTTTANAKSVLQDNNILQAQQWTGNHDMTNTVFAIVRVKYDQDHGVTGLGNIKAKIINTLNQPGAVMVDYLTNERYGAGIPLANIDTASFTALDSYSAGRYQINGLVDTSRDCLTNLVTIADSADSWLQWNEAQGKWAAIINRSLTEAGGSTSTMRVIGMDNILGGVNISPLDLNNTYNSVNVQFPNTTIRDQNDFRLLEIDPADRFTNEPNNQLSLTFPLVNNDTQATYIGWKKLYASRNDITITFTMDYSGIQIDAGDIIAIKHDWYGWVPGAYGDGTYPGKPFRVTQVRESKDANGFLTAQITATAYNDRDYIPGEHYATTQQFSGLTDPEAIGNIVDGVLTPPDAPTIPAEFLNPSKGTYIVRGNIPSSGNVIGMEFWYSVQGTDIEQNNYYLYSVQNYTEGPVYPTVTDDGETFYEEVQINDFPSGTYHWRIRAQGLNTVSAFSNPSEPVVWNNQAKIITGTQIEDNSLPGSSVRSGDPQKTGTSQSGGFMDTLGKVAAVGLGAAAVYYAYNEGWFKDRPLLWDGNGAGNDGGSSDGINPDVRLAYEDSNGNPTDNPQAGDTQIITADATPQPEPPYQVAQMDDYPVEPWQDNGDNSSWNSPTYEG